MSWSVSYSGKVKDAKKACKSSFKSQKGYYEGKAEGKVLELARKLVVLGLRHQKLDAHVSVSASGHALTDNGVEVGQNLSVSVQVVA